MIVNYFNMPPSLADIEKSDFFNIVSGKKSRLTFDWGDVNVKIIELNPCKYGFVIQYNGFKTKKKANSVKGIKNKICQELQMMKQKLDLNLGPKGYKRVRWNGQLI